MPWDAQLILIGFGSFFARQILLRSRRGLFGSMIEKNCSDQWFPGDYRHGCVKRAPLHTPSVEYFSLGLDQT